MDKESLPRWAWLLLGLFGVAMVANVVNVAVLGPAGLPEEYYVVTVIAGMSPVLIFVGLWHDEDRQEYWDSSQPEILGDALFVVLGAAVGAALTLVLLGDTGLSQLITELIAVLAGFFFAWGLFWWRNTELYASE